MGKLFPEFYVSFIYETNKNRERTLNGRHEKLAGNAHYFRKIISPFVDQVKGKRKQNVISVEWRVA